MPCKIAENGHNTLPTLSLFRLPLGKWDKFSRFYRLRQAPNVAALRWGSAGGYSTKNKNSEDIQKVRRDDAQDGVILIGGSASKKGSKDLEKNNGKPKAGIAKPMLNMDTKNKSKKTEGTAKTRGTPANPLEGPPRGIPARFSFKGKGARPFSPQKGLIFGIEQKADVAPGAGCVRCSRITSPQKKYCHEAICRPPIQN